MRTISQVLKRRGAFLFKTATINLIIVAVAIISSATYFTHSTDAVCAASNTYNAIEDRATQGWDSSAIAGYTADGVVGAYVSPITPAFSALLNLPGEIKLNHVRFTSMETG